MKSLFYRLVGGFHHFGSDFLRVIYSILNASVILERNENLARNETRLAGNENCLARHETRLARNEMRGGNLHLSGTVGDRLQKCVRLFQYSDWLPRKPILKLAN